MLKIRNKSNLIIRTAGRSIKPNESIDVDLLSITPELKTMVNNGIITVFEYNNSMTRLVSVRDTKEEVSENNSVSPEFMEDRIDVTKVKDSINNEEVIEDKQPIKRTRRKKKDEGDN